MPRVQRIEYENACYHVMNRGRAKQMIFYGESYYPAFLETLAEVGQRFQCIIHAYCLMGNHYQRHVGSVSSIIHQVRKLRCADKGFQRKVDHLIKSIVKQATGPLSVTL